jgi:hypothetical protein
VDPLLFPVTASSATSELFFASTYIVSPATIGLNWYTLLSPIRYVQAGRSVPTLAGVICVRSTYFDESGPPP